MLSCLWISVKFVDMLRNKTGYKIVEPAHMVCFFNLLSFLLLTIKLLKLHNIFTNFQEMAKPTIGDAFQSCVQQGARRVIIAPFFLATGKHINKVDFHIFFSIPIIIVKSLKIFLLGYNSNYARLCLGYSFFECGGC